MPWEVTCLIINCLAPASHHDCLYTSQCEMSSSPCRPPFYQHSQSTLTSHATVLRWSFFGLWTKLIPSIPCTSEQNFQYFVGIPAEWMICSQDHIWSLLMNVQYAWSAEVKSKMAALYEALHIHALWFFLRFWRVLSAHFCVLFSSPLHLLPTVLLAAASSKPSVVHLAPSHIPNFFAGSLCDILRCDFWMECQILLLDSQGNLSVHPYSAMGDTFALTLGERSPSIPQ